jgi:hypothetical protein
MLQSSTSKETILLSNTSALTLTILVTIDFENYVNMTFDLTPFEGNKLKDVTSIIID